VTGFRATYRLMFGDGFRFPDARALVPYLRDLGVSHLYLPPSFQARAGSTHGYDVVDPNAISDELGGGEEFHALCGAAREAGLGVILDIVPNHMAADDANGYWTRERSKYFDVEEETGVYRRFFDIDHLAAVRQEDPEVFAETHRLIGSLVRDGVIDGLRIDHPDGLADPKGYLDRLDAEHVWVEKILDPGERLRADWPVEGTVGYEFLVDLAALFVDPAAEAPLTQLWHEVSGDRRGFGEWATEAKLEQARGPFERDVERLRRIWTPPGDLYEALSALPVYRTYVRDGVASEEDREVLRSAGIEWLLDAPPEFVTRFQQTTPPVMAKGVEDTAFYRYARLVALNDVGGDPGRFGIDVARFHEANLARAAHHPRNLLITSTHDTKRSADARARAGAVASIPGEWREWVEPRIDERFPLESYFFLQNLAAVGPISPGRVEAYVEKALREMKRASNWIDPDLDHERAVQEWAVSVDVSEMARRLAHIGDRHALGYVLLKLTVPGVADIYNGDEVQELSLVDPDNRRPIDWERVRRGDRKTELIRTVLAERVSGEYEPLDAGEGVVAFTRGDRWHVAVAVREGGDLPRLPGEPVWAAEGMALHRA
jgi:(1->4)-alpha-D-glucan 1-alpha-D-glucosylmutase